MKVEVENSNYEVIRLFKITSELQKRSARARILKLKDEIPDKVTVIVGTADPLTLTKSEIFEDSSGIDELLKYDEAWYLRESELTHSTKDLEDEEVRGLLCVICKIETSFQSASALSKLEKLVRATHIPSLIEYFYASCSPSDWEGFKELVKLLFRESYDLSTLRYSEYRERAYLYSENSNYSVVSLLNEIVQTKSEVFFDSELTGEYKKCHPLLPESNLMYHLLGVEQQR